MDDLISRKWLVECVEEGWIKFDTEKDENKFIHLVRDIAPSAQPEIIRCKDCKHYEGGWYCSAWNNSPGFPMVKEEGYCNLAERRTG